MAVKIETTKNRFLIRRRDSDNAVDDIVLESEGLTIGRLVSNDLVLNHRAVSRTHAGIKEIKGEFWLFRLFIRIISDNSPADMVNDGFLPFQRRN